MSQTGTSAWWTEVQHLRGAAARTDEARRRADQADLAARRANRERRSIDAEVASVPAPAPGPATPGPPRPRFEYDPPAPQRRREHAGPATAARRHDSPPVARRGGYGDAVAIPGRRTIEIRGRTVPAPAVPPSLDLDRSRRAPRRAVERIGPRPDRLAMWALVMGLLLIAVAITTASPT